MENHRDCKRSCCWTPYSCGKKYACPCHPKSAANASRRRDEKTAREANTRLLDYLKGK
jgi:hypothetical protein